MNDTEQRIAIAEACGWKFCPSKDNPLTGNAEPDVWVDPFGNKFWEDMPTHLPDYLNDLNAMHEAEITLSEEQYYRFMDELCFVTDGRRAGSFENEVLWWRCNIDVCAKMFKATARQRAEAIRRTLGKWEEESK